MNILEFIKKGAKAEGNFALFKRRFPDLNIDNKQVQSLINKMEKDSVFFNEGGFFRLVSLEELLKADVELGVDIKNTRALPIIDCSDNIFIAFDFDKKQWCRLDISDDRKFSYSHSIEALLK